MTKKLLYLLCFVLVLSLAGTASAEEAIVWDGTGSTAGEAWMGYNYAQPLTLGNLFEVGEDNLTVTALGVGLADGTNPPTGWHTAPPVPYTIELYEVTDPDLSDNLIDSWTLLASVEFNDGNMGYEQGIFNYQDIDPVELVAGTSYQVVEHLHGHEVWWGDIAPAAGPGLTLTGSLWGFPGMGNFLPNIEPAIRGFTVGPTFQYVPEPASMCLLGLGGVLLRRRHP